MAGAKESGSTKYQLRGYQQDASNSIIEDLEKYNSVGAVLPTGAGKSLIMIDIIDRLRPTFSIDGSILCICHLSDPLYQLLDNYQKKGERPARSTYWKSYAFPNFNYDVIFVTMQKMAKPEYREEVKTIVQRKVTRTPKYILIDEAHSFGAESYNLICKLIPDAKIIGLSATPFRSNRYSFGLFDKVSYTISMSELIDKGFLVPPNLVQISIPEDKRNDGGRIALSYKIWKERESTSGLVSIVYFPTTEIAKAALASFTQDKNCRAAYIDGKTKIREAKRILQAARDGAYDVLINCQKLETGVDIPNIGSVIMPYPVGSVVKYMQRIGRALRLYEGKKEANIYLCGEPPPIAKGSWERFHNQALKMRDPLPSEQLLEDFEEEDFDKSPPMLVEWTKKAIEACRILEGNELLAVSKLLASRKFPKKYDLFIDKILKRAQPSEGYDQSTISEIQRQIITERYGLEDRHIATLTKQEASAIINGFDAHLKSNPFIFQKGNHLGKHPSQLKPFARKWLSGENLATCKRWWKAGRPPLKEE